MKMTTFNTSSIVLANQFDKILFQVDEQSYQLLTSHNVPVRSVQRQDGVSYAVSAKVCSQQLCDLHNFITKDALKVGSKYSVVYEVYAYDFHGKAGNSVRAYITKLESKVPQLPASVASLL